MYIRFLTSSRFQLEKNWLISNITQPAFAGRQVSVFRPTKKRNIAYWHHCG
jgi:hypothetical protein